MWEIWLVSGIPTYSSQSDKMSTCPWFFTQNTFDSPLYFSDSPTVHKRIQYIYIYMPRRTADRSVQQKSPLWQDRTTGRKMANGDLLLWRLPAKQYNSLHMLSKKILNWECLLKYLRLTFQRFFLSWWPKRSTELLLWCSSLAKLEKSRFIS